MCSVQSGLWGYVSTDTHLVGQKSHHAFIDHIIEGALNLFPVLYWYLPLGMLDRGDSRVSPDGIGARHVAYCIEGSQGWLTSRQ